MNHIAAAAAAVASVKDGSNNDEVIQEDLLELLDLAKTMATALLRDDDDDDRLAGINDFNLPSSQHYDSDEHDIGRQDKIDLLIQNISGAIEYERKYRRKQQTPTNNYTTKKKKNMKIDKSMPPFPPRDGGVLVPEQKQQRQQKQHLPTTANITKNLLEVLIQCEKITPSVFFVRQNISHAIGFAYDILLPRIEKYYFLTSPPPQNSQQQQQEAEGDEPTFCENKLVFLDRSCTNLRHVLALFRHPSFLSIQPWFWVTPTACLFEWILPSNIPNFIIPQDYYCIWPTLKGCGLRWAIYGRTEADAVNCLMYLMNLPSENNFVEFQFSGRVHQIFDVTRFRSRDRFRCPIENIAALLSCQQHQHKYTFKNVIFSSSQSSDLANSIIVGGKSIIFTNCLFEDGGKGFADTFCNYHSSGRVSSIAGIATAAAKHVESVDGFMKPVKLSFERNATDGEQPFNPYHMNRFLTSNGLVNINLYFETLVLRQDYCEGFKNCMAKSLCLRYCDYTDGTVFGSLAEAIRSNRGPREIAIDYEYVGEGDVIFENDVGRDNPNIDYKDFIDALGSDDHHRVKRLHISFRELSWDQNVLNIQDTQVAKLLNALRTNRSLEHLNFITYPDDCNYMEGPVCDAIQDHPTISSLVFRNVDQSRIIDTLSDLLKKNLVLETIRFRHSRSVLGPFNARISPILVLNKYRKLFHRYRTYELQEKTLAIALARISTMNNPSLLFMLVCDTIGCNGGNLRVSGITKRPAKKPRLCSLQTMFL